MHPCPVTAAREANRARIARLTQTVLDHQDANAQTPAPLAGRSSGTTCPVRYGYHAGNSTNSPQR